MGAFMEWLGTIWEAIKRAFIRLLEMFRLGIDRVLGFLRSRSPTTDDIAFTLQEKLRTGQFRTIPGVLNKITGEIKTGEVEEIHSQEIDSTLADYHRNDELVVFT